MRRKDTPNKTADSITSSRSKKSREVARSPLLLLNSDFWIDQPIKKFSTSDDRLFLKFEIFRLTNNFKVSLWPGSKNWPGSRGLLYVALLICVIILNEILDFENSLVRMDFLICYNIFVIAFILKNAEITRKCQFQLYIRVIFRIC